MTATQPSPLANRVSKIPVEQLADYAMTMARRTDDAAGIVLEAVLDRMMEVFTEEQFVKFCASLEGAMA